MKIPKLQLTKRIQKYHFELKHLLVVFVVLIFFQMLTSLVHKISLRNFLIDTQDWYQQDFAERLANLSATSLELLFENTLQHQPIDDDNARKIVQAFNIILSQQLLQQHVQEVCLLLVHDGKIIAIDNGLLLATYLFQGEIDQPTANAAHTNAILMYEKIQKEMVTTEQTHCIVEGKQTFHVFVPFVPKGEYFGALYMRSNPEFDFVTSGIITSYNETSMIFTGLILIGLLAMFYISSRTVKERDEAQQLLFQERERQIKENIHHQKEALFTKRIYHTHHKAEKVMGFIKEDLRVLAAKNIEEIKYRVTKYANFISRVIYDMKWYDPPLHVIRNPLFRTNLNEVIRFLVDHIFLRIARSTEQYQFDLDLDDRMPIIPVNEFVIWEILEPLLQNSLDHAGNKKITIRIRTLYNPEIGEAQITIADDGCGIQSELLAPNEEGIKRLFMEHVSTKGNGQNSGYGCYIAYEIAKQRCGWNLDAENLDGAGCQFIISIPHLAKRG